MSDVGYFESIKAYVRGEQLSVNGTQQPRYYETSKRGSFQGKKVATVAGAGFIGVIYSAVACAPIATLTSVVITACSIHNSIKVYKKNKTSLPKLIINILVELTIGFAIRTIITTFTAFIDLSLMLITKIVNIKTIGEPINKNLSMKFLEFSIAYHNPLHEYHTCELSRV
jgi:hypothetical protein